MWKEEARQYAKNAEYYRGLVIRCGKAIGKEAFIADDGTVSEDVLCAKVPEIVEEMCATNGLPPLTMKIAKQKYGNKFAKKTGYRAQIFDGDNLVNQFMDYCETAEEAERVVEKYFGRKLPTTTQCVEP
jgi:hypothetical protein